MPGQLLDGRLRERPDGQGVDVLADHPGEVGHALADAEADVLAVEEQRIAAELGDRRLEADAGPERGLVEDQAQGPAGEPLRAARPLRSSRFRAEARSSNSAASGALMSNRSMKCRTTGRTSRVVVSCQLSANFIGFGQPSN